MGISISVDIGGTFTDFHARSEDGKTEITKTPTTHYDLSVGFMKGMKTLARSFGKGLSDFLGQSDVVRYCTTMGTNALIERTGPNWGSSPPRDSRMPFFWVALEAGPMAVRSLKTRTWPAFENPNP